MNPMNIPIRYTVFFALSASAASCGTDELAKLVPSIRIEPERIDLGSPPVGTLNTHRVIVLSDGATGLALESIAFVEDGTTPRSSDLALSLPEGLSLPTVLAPSQQHAFEIRHVPRDQELDLGVVRIRSDDPERRELSLDVVERREGAPVVRVVAEVARADIEADTPGGVRSEIEALDFGVVPANERRSLELFIVNGGSGNVPLAVEAIAVSDPVRGLEVHSVPAPDAEMARPVLLPALGVVSRSAATRSLRVRLDWQPNPSEGDLDPTLQLRISSNDPSRPRLDLPILGRSARAPAPDDPPPPTTCTSRNGARSDPGEPRNDSCAGSIERGPMTLSGNGTERILWSDGIMDRAQDVDWTRVMLRVEAGCLFVGYDIGATVVLPPGEEAEICVYVGDCAAPDFSRCGTGSARAYQFPADSICEKYGNEVPVHVAVRHLRGSLTCTPYAVNFDAR